MAASRARFGAFVLDLTTRTLVHEGRAVPLKGKAMDVLCTLAAAQGETVPKEELLAKVWPGLVVEEGNIQVQVSAIRKAIDDAQNGPRHLITVARVGYRFVADEWSAPADEAQTSGDMGPSIAVLPFARAGARQRDEDFARGVTEQVIAGLSRFAWLSVIGRSSSAVYDGPNVDVTRVGRELCIRYVLQGEVSVSLDRVRVSAALLAAANGRQLWAERYDRRVGELFDIQDDIAARVIGAIEPGLRTAEIDRVRRTITSAPGAYELVMRALPFVFRLMPSAMAPALPLLERSLSIDPSYAAAHAYLAWCHHVRFSRGGLHPADRDNAVRHARSALAHSHGDPTTVAIVAFVLWFELHDVGRSFELFDQALGLSPSNTLALSTSAIALAWTGKCDLALARAKRALELSPFDSLNYLCWQAMSGSWFQLGQFDKAQEAARRAVDFNAEFSVPYAYLTAAQVRLGDLTGAKQTIRTLVGIQPGFSIDGFRRTVGVEPAVFDRFAAAWREAGLTEA